MITTGTQMHASPRNSLETRPTRTGPWQVRRITGRLSRYSFILVYTYRENPVLNHFSVQLHGIRFEDTERGVLLVSMTSLMLYLNLEQCRHSGLCCSLEVLKISSGIEEIGGIVWELACCLLIAWLVVFFTLIRGISSLGKARN